MLPGLLWQSCGWAVVRPESSALRQCCPCTILCFLLVSTELESSSVSLVTLNAIPVPLSVTKAVFFAA